MRPPLERFTLVDGVLALECEPDLVPLLHRWLPRDPLSSRRSERSERLSGSTVRHAERPAAPSSVVAVRRARHRSPPNTTVASRTLSLGGCSAWIDGHRATLASASEDVNGVVHLDQGRAEIHVNESGPVLEGALTIAAALLLGRAQHALVHSGAIVSSDGQGWLVVGDAHSGKSTLTAGAIVGGWRYAADDQCVLHADAGGTVIAHGWPREFHLDDGWGTGKPSGVRRTIVPDTELAAGSWERSASVVGIIMPTIARGQATQLRSSTSATALAALIRQSPWLAADRVVTRESMALLERTSSLPCFTLRMGLDSYADRSVLVHLLDHLGARGKVLAPS